MNEWIKLLISAIIGGCISAILFPIVSYFFIRWINRRGIRIRPGTLIDGLDKKHRNLPLIITNTSFSSIKNVVAYLTLNFTKEDFRGDYDIDVFNAETPIDHQLTLSWSKQLGDRIVPYTDINQGESADLNLFRIHRSSDITVNIHNIQIPSENGFSHKDLKRRGRLLLNGDKEYDFSILITADNMIPIKRRYRFVHDLINPHIDERF